MTIEEATNVTLEDAIKCFEHTIFPQDFSPYTLRAKAINELVLAALRTQLQENKPLTLEELRGMRGEPVYVVKGKCQWWDIVDFTAGGWLYLRIANKTDLALDDYGTKWLAYRRRPEVQDG